MAIIAFMLIFVYFYPLTLRFSYKEQQAELHWLPRLCGGFAAPRALPLGNKSGQNKAAQNKPGKKLLTHKRFFTLLPIIRRLLSHVCVEKLHCCLQMGVSSPFAGSILLGLALAAFGSANGAASTLFKRFPASPHLELATIGQGSFNASIECILCIRCGDIIGDILYGLWKTRGQVRKNKRGRKNVR